MAFNIGDLVVPTINQKYFDEIVPTIGASGTIISRVYIGKDPTEIDVYRYEVDMSEDYSVKSGTLTLSNFWFEETQLEGGTNNYQEVLNVEEMCSTIQNAQNQVKVSLDRVSLNLDQMKSTTTFYTAVENIKKNMDTVTHSMANIPLDMTDSTSITNTIPVSNETAITMNSNSILMSELSDNFKGFHDALAVLDEESLQIREQADVQLRKAREDDALNRKVYNDTYVTSHQYKNLLVPTEGEVLPVHEEIPPIIDSLDLDLGDD